MNRERSSVPQLGAWLLAAMAGPICCLTAGQSWITVLLVLAAGGLICGWAMGLNAQVPKWLILPVCGLIVWTVSWWTGLMADSWRSEGADPAVELTLLLLAACAADAGAEKAGRACAALFWLLALLFGVMIGAGFKGIRLEWIPPEPEMPTLALLSAAGIPFLAVLLPRKEGKLRPWLAALAVFGALVSVVTLGSLSPQVARADRFPFDRYCRGLTVLGAAKRLGSLAAAGLTLSWFCTVSLALAAVDTQASRLHPKAGRYSVWAAALICAAVSRLPGSGAAAAPIFWAAGIVLAQAVVAAKKYKKRQKNP